MHASLNIYIDRSNALTGLQMQVTESNMIVDLIIRAFTG